jgi:hypothetical protein
LSTNPNLVLAFLRRSIVTWVGAVFVVAGCVGVYEGLHEWQRSRRFEREAVPAEATVVAKSLAAANRDEGTSTKYSIVYRFTANNGDSIEQREDLPVEDWERLDEGSLLEVRYLPSTPSTARSRPENPWWVPPLITGVTTLFVLIGLAIARRGVRRAFVIARVQRAGVTAQATVQKVWATGTTINRVRQWQLSYEFRDHAGVTQRGESDLLAPHEAADWQPGAHGVVRYDRARPTDSVWLGKA